jgi:FAD/FMN-containing dehydrogenase
MINKGKTQTRREFIKKSALAAGIIPIVYAKGPSFIHSRTSFDKDAINKFRKGFNGHIILPGDSEYEMKRRVGMMNPKMDKHPALIASCKDEQDILRSIDFARKQQLEIAVRSGNHSNMGWGSCDKGMVIDLSEMKGIAVDADKKSVVVTTGVSAEEILASTAPHSLAPVLGQCGSVGAGILLGGGVGWLAGKYGATCDNLLSARVITAEAQILHADSATNPDLFWAIRGGGGNFGIATSYRYRLQSVNEILGGKFTYPISKARSVLRFFYEFMATAPDELQGDCRLTNETCHAEFVYCGDLDKGELLLERFRKVNKPDEDSVKRRPFSEVYNMYADVAEAPCPFGSIKGTYIERLTEEVIDLVLEHLAKPPRSCSLVFNFSHYMHGEVCRVLPDATAFELRKAGALHLVFWVIWKDAEDTSSCMTWHNELFERLQVYSGGRIYANYMSTPGGASAKKVFGSNLPRLARLKKKYDPENLFHLNQNILPAE